VRTGVRFTDLTSSRLHVFKNVQRAVFSRARVCWKPGANYVKVRIRTKHKSKKCDGETERTSNGDKFKIELDVGAR
jgi:hypothetical protein